mgnify:CR=1 FL=1
MLFRSPNRPTPDPGDRIEKSLDTLIPDDPAKPYDMKELIVKVVDEGDFFELQPDYAGNIIVGFGRMEGSTVGIVANQPLVLAGCLDISSSTKGARFVDRKSTRLNSSHVVISYAVFCLKKKTHAFN